jgi:hypothetical protein
LDTLGFRLLLKVSNTVLWKYSSESVATYTLVSLKAHYLRICLKMYSFGYNRIGGAGAHALADCLKLYANMKEFK